MLLEITGNFGKYGKFPFHGKQQHTTGCLLLPLLLNIVDTVAVLLLLLLSKISETVRVSA